MFKVEYRYNESHPKTGNLVKNYPRYFRRPAIYQTEKTLNQKVPDWKERGPLILTWDSYTGKDMQPFVERFTYRHDGNGWVRIN